MTRSTSRFAVAAALAVATLGSVAAWTGDAAANATAVGAPNAVAATTPPFAKVYLALRGCTSCAHCRTTIRQMAKGSAKGGEARVAGDQVEVLYKTPRVLPLRDVIATLAENRLHDLGLVDVLLEARGTIGTTPDGTLRFTLAETGQSFPIALPAGVAPPAPGTAVRLVAVVNGWREKTNLTLTAREIRPST